MKTLLIGGGGYLGTVLTAQLLEEGHSVRVYDRFYFGKSLFAHYDDDRRVELLRGDSRSVDRSVFEGVDSVVLLAALSNDPTADLDPSLTQSINLDGTLQAAQVAKDAGVRRIVFSSSCSVYGAAPEGHLHEDSPKRPVSLYAKLKITAEDALNELATDDYVVTSLRHATVYGPSPRMRFDLVVNLMTLHAFKNQKIYVMGGGEQWRPLVHVRDVARAFLTALSAPAAKVQREAFNVGSDEQNYQVKTIAAMVAQNVPGTAIEVVPDDPDKRTYQTSFRKIREQLGFTPAHQVPDAVREIHDALRLAHMDDGIRTKTLAFYRYLLEAERLVRDLSIDGKLL